jgi:hypothetical protein
MPFDGDLFVEVYLHKALSVLMFSIVRVKLG